LSTSSKQPVETQIVFRTFLLATTTAEDSCETITDATKKTNCAKNEAKEDQAIHDCQRFEEILGISVKVQGLVLYRRIECHVISKSQCIVVLGNIVIVLDEIILITKLHVRIHIIGDTPVHRIVVHERRFDGIPVFRWSPSVDKICEITRIDTTHPLFILVLFKFMKSEDKKHIVGVICVHGIVILIEVRL
ncbi:hypothetical protein PENTCL1PPCAC_9809, partial [Pristionchus entomophagus]